MGGARVKRRATGHGGRRIATCTECHAAGCWAEAPWGRVLLEPFPEGDGELYVDVLRAGLLVLGPKDRRSNVTKRWNRHRCPRQGVPRPKPQPEQLGLF